MTQLPENIAAIVRNNTRSREVALRRTLPFLGLLFVVAVLVFTVFYLAYQNFSFLGFENQVQAPVQHPNAWRVSVLIVATLVGIVAGYFHIRLQGGGQSRFVPMTELKEMFYSPDFYRGLFASPIVFSVIYLAANQQPDDLIAFLLAFENGFFWNRVLERRMTTASASSGHLSSQ